MTTTLQHFITTEEAQLNSIDEITSE